MPDLRSDRMARQRFVARVAASRLDQFESQHVFRVLLDSLARPGTIHRFHASLAGRIPPVFLPTLALVDVDTPFAVVSSAEGSADEWAEVVQAATSAPLVEAEGGFCVVAPLGIDAHAIRRLRTGTASAPELGARLSLGCDSVESGHHPGRDRVCLTVSGPGIPGARQLTLGGVTAEVIDALVAANADRPCGIDTWLIEPDATVMALARTTRIEIINDPIGRGS